jgi:hypothetical protein
MVETAGRGALAIEDYAVRGPELPELGELLAVRQANRWPGSRLATLPGAR